MGRRSRNIAAATLPSAIVICVSIVIWHPWPRHGLDRVQHVVDWPDECSVARGTPITPRIDQWADVRVATSVGCSHGLGPYVDYVRFSDAAALATAVRHAPPEERACALGSQLVIDGLSDGEFAGFCRRWGGELLR